MKNASCFQILFLVDNQLHFPKEASQSNPLFCTLESPLSILLCIQIHTKWLTQWHPKVIASGVKQHLSNQSMHPTYHCILFGPPLLQLAISGPHKNHSTPSLLHQQWSFTVFGFSSALEILERLSSNYTYRSKKSSTGDNDVFDDIFGPDKINQQEKSNHILTHFKDSNDILCWIWSCHSFTN